MSTFVIFRNRDSKCFRGTSNLLYRLNYRKHLHHCSVIRYGSNRLHSPLQIHLGRSYPDHSFPFYGLLLLKKPIWVLQQLRNRPWDSKEPPHSQGRKRSFADHLRNLHRGHRNRTGDHCFEMRGKVLLLYFIIINHRHYYHAPCIRSWLLQKVSCPNCRSQNVI